jgi:signal transduction histidine kinase
MSELPDAQSLRRLRHDVRSPLMVITGFAQLLGGARDLTPEERIEYASRIQNAAEELKRVLDDALDRDRDREIR